MDRDDAVLDLAQVPAPLPLHTGRVRPLLDEAGLAGQADRHAGRVLGRDDLLDSIAHALLVPGQVREKLLQLPRRRPGLERHRLDALPRQVRQLPPRIRGQIALGLILKTVREPGQKRLQLRPQFPQRLRIHAQSPISPSGTRVVTDFTKREQTGLAL